MSTPGHAAALEELNAAGPELVTTVPVGPDANLMGQGLVRALEAIPSSFARVIELVDLGDHAYQDAANELGVPVGTVMSRLFRGRRLLANRLRGDVKPEACRPELPSGVPVDLHAA